MGGCEAVGKLKAGSLSPDNRGLSAAWWLYQGRSAGPLVWTCEIDGSSSFSVGGGNGSKNRSKGGAVDVGLDASNVPGLREMRRFCCRQVMRSRGWQGNSATLGAGTAAGS